MMQVHADQRASIMPDMYRLVFDGLRHVKCQNIHKDAEVILHSRMEVAAAMIEGGVLTVLEDIIMTETNQTVLVCYRILYFHRHDLFYSDNFISLMTMIDA